MKHVNGHSRLPLNMPTYVEPVSIDNVCFSSFPLNDIALEMQNDRILTEVYRAILDEWPREVPIGMKPYYLKRNSLSSEDKCAFYGNRVVIPRILRHHITDLLHEGHIGVVRMKAYGGWV